MNRRRFSIRTLLIVLVVVGLSLSWLTSNQRLTRLERQAISEIQANYSGFKVIDRSTPLFCGTGVSGIADRNPTNPVNRVFGAWWPETFDRVTSVSINGLRYDNDVLYMLDKFPKLNTVSINQTSVSAIAINVFKKSNPHVQVEFVESTFELTDENNVSQMLQSMNHW